MSIESTPPPENLPPPPSPTDTQEAKTPTTITWGFVLSVLGFCGITAIVGVILGFVGRKEAKEVGKGVGLSTAAIVIGAAWILFGLIGLIAGALTDDTEPVEQAIEESVETTEETPEEPEPEPTATETDEPIGNIYSTFGVTIDELPNLWNEAVQAYGSGNELPDNIEGEIDVLGLEGVQYDLDNGNYVNISWQPDNRELVEIIVGGFTDDPDVATSIIANAAAMTFATSDLGLAEAETFIVDDLIGDSLDGVTDSPQIAEFIEQDDRTYNFTFFANTVSFTVTSAIE